MSSSFPDFAQRLNLFLYRQNIRRLGESDIGLARDWSLALIRREHPDLTEEEIARFYENLIHVRIIAVDEWTRRMSYRDRTYLRSAALILSRQTSCKS